MLMTANHSISRDNSWSTKDIAAALFSNGVVKTRILTTVKIVVANKLYADERFQSRVPPIFLACLIPVKMIRLKRPWADNMPSKISVDSNSVGQLF